MHKKVSTMHRLLYLIVLFNSANNLGGKEKKKKGKIEKKSDNMKKKA